MTTSRRRSADRVLKSASIARTETDPLRQYADFLLGVRHSLRGVRLVPELRFRFPLEEGVSALVLRQHLQIANVRSRSCFYNGSRSDFVRQDRRARTR